jgi:hypothetical protein
MSSDHARREPRFSTRRLDVLLQETVGIPANISGPRIGPCPAFVVGDASRLAKVVAVAAFKFETSVIAAIPVDRGLNRTVAGLDDAGAAHSRNAAIVLHAPRHAVLQPTDGGSGSIAWVVEAPGPTAPVPFTGQRAIRRIARGQDQAQVVATGTIKIRLRVGPPHGGSGRKNSECHQTPNEQAASPHSQCFQPIGLARIFAPSFDRHEPVPRMNGGPA